MQLNYDLDILPRDAGAAATHFAAFRDPRTAAAARQASSRTLAILNDAGIALEPYSSGTPEGHYPLKDQEAQAYLASCMLAAMTTEPELEATVGDGAFSLSDCLVSMSAARPYGALVPKSDEPIAQVMRKPLSVYVALSVLSVAGYMTGFAFLN